MGVGAVVVRRGVGRVAVDGRSQGSGPGGVGDEYVALEGLRGSVSAVRVRLEVEVKGDGVDVVAAGLHVWLASGGC